MTAWGGALAPLAFSFAAGYVVASLWSSSRDTRPLAQICARVDGLQENLKGGQDAASDEVGGEVKALVEQCRTTLRNRADENATKPNGRRENLRGATQGSCGRRVASSLDGIERSVNAAELRFKFFLALLQIVRQFFLFLGIQFLHVANL
jgi:hypothetical protein